MISRQVVEGTQLQGKDERIAYVIDVTKWGSTPTGVSAKLYDVTDGAYTDVTSTCLSGSASVVGNNITTPRVIILTQQHDYRLEVLFIIGGNTLEAIVLIHGEL